MQDVLVSFDRAEAGTLYIDIHYSIRGTNDPRNLVFPFYVIPEEPGCGRRRRSPHRLSRLEFVAADRSG